MLEQGEPRWRRRKAERPAEIVAAALAVFSEKGFAAARLDDIAREAGVSKGALYLYFETKEALFRAVVEQSLLPAIAGAAGAAASGEGSFETRLRLVMARISEAVSGARVGRVLKVVIGESRNFPELARIWHETVVARGLGLVSALIAEAQARGEIRAGEPRLLALSIVAPIVVGELWRETFVPVGAEPIDVRRLLSQHADVVLDGLRAPGS